jgi:hypothetical protein
MSNDSLAVNQVSGTRELKDLLVAACKAGVPALILGPPGVGKTSLIRQVAAELGRTYHSLDAQMASPEDLTGIPWVQPDGETMRSTRPSWLPAENNDKGVVFVDDLGNCPSPVIMSGLYAFALDAKSGSHALHPDTWRVMASNRPSDKSGAVAMNPTLANRLMVLQYAGPSDTEWLQDFANPSGVNIHVREFIGAHPTSLNAFNGTQPTNSTPRSWALAGRMIDALGTADLGVLRTALAGIVNGEDAVKLITNIQIGHLVPTIASIVADPDRAIMPPKDRLDLQYALLGRIKAGCDPVQFNKVWDYFSRPDTTVRKELQVTAVKFMQMGFNNELSAQPCMAKILKDAEIRRLFA